MLTVAMPFSTSLAFGSLRAASLMVFARLRLAARYLQRGLLL
jgi:hypothetical protein